MSPGPQNDSRKDTKSGKKHTNGHTKTKKQNISLISEQLVPCFSHRLLFWSFCCRPGGFGRLKVVKNTVGSFEIEGFTFSTQSTYFARKCTLGHPKTTPGTTRDTPRDPNGPTMARFLARSFAVLNRFLESGQKKPLEPGSRQAFFQVMLTDIHIY